MIQISMGEMALILTRRRAARFRDRLAIEINSTNHQLAVICERKMKCWKARPAL